MNQIDNLTRFLNSGATVEQAANVLKAMANESRLLLLCNLSVSGELSVGQLVERIGLSQSALSQHLARLREERLVATRKDAQTVYYRLCDSKVEQLLALLHDLYCPDLGNHDQTQSPRS
jgi:ArsR family transcriptional regulator